MTRYFVYQDATSRKFWHLETAGSQLLVRYGKLGTAGQQQTKRFADSAAADKEADKLVKEKLRKGYVETASAAEIPLAGAPTSAAAASAAKAVPPALQLLPEKVAGKHIMLVGEFKRYRLGSKAEVKALLEAHGATLVPSTSNRPYDFVLGGYQAEDVGGYQRLVFEEELCAPLPPADPNPFADFRARLWPMLRELIQHPLIKVSGLLVAPPLTEGELSRAERKLGRPLPALLRAFYQHIGQLRLYWYYTTEKAQRPQLYLQARHSPDVYDNHEGQVNVLPLSRVLSDEWFNPELCFDLQPNQPVFDFYSDFYMRAIELGAEADPPMLHGDDYGVSFDSHGHLSDYPGWVLSYYGWQKGPAGPFDLDNKAGFETNQEVNSALDGYLYGFKRSLPANQPSSPYQQGVERRFFELLDYARQHRPAFSVDGYRRHLRQRTPTWLDELPLLNSPRFQALLSAVRAEIWTHGDYVGVKYTDPGQNVPLSGEIRFFNGSEVSVTITGYELELLFVAANRETLVGATDATPQPDFTSPLPWAFPLEVAAGQTQQVPFNFPALAQAELALLLTRLNWKALEEGMFGLLRLRAPLSQGEPLTDEQRIHVYN